MLSPVNTAFEIDRDAVVQAFVVEGLDDISKRRVGPSLLRYHNNTVASKPTWKMLWAEDVESCRDVLLLRHPPGEASKDKCLPKHEMADGSE